MKNSNLMDRIRECLNDQQKRLNDAKDNPVDPGILQSRLIIEMLIEIAREIEVIKRKVL